ncbi:ATP:cob(I)alamin adenosyltransferase, partial [Alcaligenaceae bacterium 429]
SRAAALAHQARTVARRAERSVVSLLQFDAVRPVVQQYLNRLSDLCFILARCLNKHADRPDVLWQPQAKS